MKKNIVFLIFMVFSLLLIGCDKQKTEIQEARKLSGKSDLESKMEARSIFIKYQNVDLGAKNDLKLVNKNIGEIYYFDRNFKQAMKYFKQSLDIDTNQAIIHYYLGVCYANLYKSEIIDSLKKEYKELAKFHYKRAIELQSDLEQAYYGLAMFYYVAEERYDDALKLLDQVLDINPEYLSALYVKRQIKYILGNVQESLNISLEIQRILKSRNLQSNDRRPKEIREDIEKLKTEIGE